MTWEDALSPLGASLFQYRKRYEVTCDALGGGFLGNIIGPFQYRKRYEVTCDQIVL